MIGHAPVFAGRRYHNAAQPRMGVDEPAIARGDHNVELACADTRKLHVAGLSGAFHGGEAAFPGDPGKAGNGARAQLVGSGQRCLTPNRLERGGEHTHTVQTCGGVSAVEPES